MTLLVALEEPGTGVTFQEQTTPNRVEAKYIDGVEEGVRQALAAAKCADATVFLRDYIFLDVAKTVNAFRMAGKLCVEEALTRL